MPRPAPPPDPNLKSWYGHLIGKKMQLFGFVEAVSEAAVIEATVLLFGLNDERRKRLTINPRR